MTVLPKGRRTFPVGTTGRRYSVSVIPEPSSGGTDGGPGDPGVRALEHQNETLQHENEVLCHELAASDPGSAEPKQRRGRTVASWVLIMVACLLAILSVVVVYARNELLNTDTFVATVAPLAKDPNVQMTVATKVSDNLVARTDVEQRVTSALPAKAGFLAYPITGAVHRAMYQITLKLVQSSQFQHLWEQALRRSHAQLDNLLLGNKVGAFQSTKGQVTVDLTQVENAAKRQLSARGLTVFNKVPNYTGAPFVLFQPNQLAKLQRWIKFLDHLALVLPIVSILMLAGAVLLVRDRRRGFVHAASGLFVSMALLLIAANVGRNQYLSSLKVTQSKATTAAVIDTVDDCAARYRPGGAGPGWSRGARGICCRTGARPAVDARTHDAGVAVERARVRHRIGVPQGVPVGGARTRTCHPGRVEPADGQGGADHRAGHPLRRDAGGALRRSATVHGRATRRRHRGRAGSGAERRRHHRLSPTHNELKVAAARDWWLTFEPVHAVVYFDPGCLAATDALGLRGFWMGYLAGRAAPFGPVGPEPVTASFFNFHPDRARRALPAA